MKLPFGITLEFKPKEDNSEAIKKFRELNYEIMYNERGQAWLFLLKQICAYDMNSYTACNKDSRMSDMHEGSKDLVRKIEAALQTFHNQKQKKDKKNAGKETKD